MDLSQETTENLACGRHLSSGLGSTRDKPDAKYREHIFQVFRAHNVRYFFYIGGNDSSDTVRIVNEHAKKSNYDFRAIHIPKTIDNDLMCNDHTPGFPSAARFVAQAFMGINLDNRALPGVHISVIMGRHAGFLAAASAAARKYPDDGPHLIYTPERPFSIDKFLIDVKSSMTLGRCVISVSEGIQTRTDARFGKHDNPPPTPTATYSYRVPALGELLANKAKEKLSIGRVRSDTFGYLQLVHGLCK